MIKIFTFLLLIGCVWSKPLLPSIAGKLNKVIFIYPIGVQSERDLFVCPKNSACNIIHKRFWLPPIVERICKCPQRHDCNWTWSENSDNYTMALNNRSQIKFCEKVQLPRCTIKKPALRIVVQSSSLNKESNATTTSRHQIFYKTSRHTEAKNVTALCNCKDPHYWKLKMNSTIYDDDRMHQSYMCSKLRKCTRFEFCGYVRTDTYSTYYRCSCPKGHLCISQDKSLFRVEELLFNGYGYKAYCLPV